jgi:mRNA-degrading endonuclease YafQ of YafQ-DinJ toxin-antitoxin module
MEPILHKNFKKNFKKLSTKIKAKFYERLAIFKEDKFHSILDNHSVDKRYPGCRSIDINGDYRVIFRELDGVNFFVNIGTHSELYGK